MARRLTVEELIDREEMMALEGEASIRIAIALRFPMPAKYLLPAYGAILRECPRAAEYATMTVKARREVAAALDRARVDDTPGIAATILGLDAPRH